MKIIDTRYGLHEIVIAKFHRYQNGQTAIKLETTEGEPWLSATVAVPQAIPAGCVGIKDWSENEGVPDVLTDGGLIEGEPVQHVRSGFVTIPVYRLTPAALAEIRV
jgi:hypothetical protein